MIARLLRVPRRIDLTPRQVEVLRLIERGRTNADIAQDLGISLDGAKYHVREIMGKLGADSREDAVALWRAQRSAQRRAPAWMIGLAGTAAAAVVALMVVALGAFAPPDGEVPIDDTPEPVGQTPTIAAALAPCDSRAVTYSLHQRPTDTIIEYTVTARSATACRLKGSVTLRILDTAGIELDIETNGLPMAFDAPLPTDEPIV